MSHHLVAIFGGAVSGAEAAHQLSQSGIQSIVFEQNKLPYGKIEDGLPKWHAKLRDKEENNINEKLSNANVTFVPCVRLGQDIDFEDIAKNWGFSAILLATGAWRDRPLPIEGVDLFINKGLYYQNPFMYWFNHFHEPGYQGQNFDVKDGALVIGGGLASIDVAKVLMILTVQEALKKRGIEEDIFSLERSISKVLESHNLTLEALGLKGCTLMYRKRIKDMPLYPGETDTPEQIAKAETIREKILENARAKYLFNVLPMSVPVDKIVENDNLAGLVFQKTEFENGKWTNVENSDFEIRSPLTISSIGSIPEPVSGIPWKGEIIKLEEDGCCRIKGHSNVFALGNAVTGRGNILESLKHGREISQTVVHEYLTEPEVILDEQLRGKESVIQKNVKAVVQQIARFAPPTDEQKKRIFEKVNHLLSRIKYPGDYMEWVKMNLPPRYEQIMGLQH